MQYGDLSNEVVPRLVLIFEGALGFLDQQNRKRYDKAMKYKRYDEALDQWDINPLMAAKIWDVTKRKSFTLSVYSFLDDSLDFQTALEYRLADVEELPIHGAVATTEDKLARAIAYMPDLYKIYDPLPRGISRWGSKGFFIKDVNQLGE